MKTHVILAGCAFALVGLLYTPLWAATTDVVAPLNETGTIVGDDTGSYTLRVNTKGKKITADSFHVIQGDADTQYTIDASHGSGSAKRVAIVEKKAGDVLYRVSGTYVKTGGGTAQSSATTKGWKADYNKGSKRMVLYVNTTPTSDDFVGHGDTGTVTVMLSFDNDNTEYSINLYNGAGEGVIHFTEQGGETWATTKTFKLGMVNGDWEPSITFDIKGVTPGWEEIQAAPSDPDNSILVETNADCPVLIAYVKSVGIKLANSEDTDGALKVYDDDGKGDVGLTAEWTSAGRRESAAFTMAENKKIKFDVTFKGPKNTTVTVRAKSPDGTTTYVNETTVEFGADETEKEIEGIVVQDKIGNEVDLKQWSLQWQYKSGVDWIDTTQTEHRIYVALKTPVMPSQPFAQGKSAKLKTRDSYFFLACTGAKGADSIDSVRTNLWLYVQKSANNTGSAITRRDMRRLGFWRDTIPHDPGTGNVWDFITKTDGNCKAWAYLFAASLGIHGDTSTCKNVGPNPALFAFPDNAQGMAFIVAEWNWDPEVAGDKAPWNWRFDTTTDAPYPDNRWTSWGENIPDCTDAGRKAHDNPQAHGEWSEHALVVLDGKWYDPSYGLGNYASLAAYEAGAMKTGNGKAGGYVIWVLDVATQKIFAYALKDPANAQFKIN